MGHFVYKGKINETLKLKKKPSFIAFSSPFIAFNFEIKKKTNAGNQKLNLE